MAESEQALTKKAHLQRCARNQVEPRESILEQAISALEVSTGLRARTLRCSAERENPSNPTVEIQSPSGHDTFRFEVVEAEGVQPGIGTGVRLSSLWPLLMVVPYVSNEVANRCRNSHLRFLDLSGNVYLEEPGLFAYVTGRKRLAPVVRRKTFRASTPAGLRVVFALLTQRGLVHRPYREIALAAGVGAPATIGETFADLEARGFLHTEASGKRRILAVERLCDEWISQFSIRLRPKLRPQRFSAGNPFWWREANLPAGQAWWSGEVAGAKLTHNLRPARVMLYATSLSELVVAHRLRKDPKGKAEILRPFWSSVSVDQQVPVDVVHPLLIYADLLEFPDPRNLEIAESIRERFLNALDPN